MFIKGETLGTISSKPPIRRCRTIDYIKRDIIRNLKEENYKKANNLINNGINKYPKDADFIKFKASYCFKTENFQDAFKYFDLALKCDFKNSGLLDMEFINFLKCHEILNIPYSQLVLEHLILNPQLKNKVDDVTTIKKKSKKI